VTFRPANELQGLSGCVGIGFGLVLVAGAILVSGPETTVIGRVLVAGFGLFIAGSIAYSYRAYWYADELVTTADELVVWSKGHQAKFGWQTVDQLVEDSQPESVDYFLKVQGRPTIPLGEGEEARWFLYECARISGVKVTKKGKPKA
jgi:hypothetical protein